MEEELSIALSSAWIRNCVEPANGSNYSVKNERGDGGCSANSGLCTPSLVQDREAATCSMKLARLISRSDKPAHSCVLRIMWTYNKTKIPAVDGKSSHILNLSHHCKWLSIWSSVKYLHYFFPSSTHKISNSGTAETRWVQTSWHSNFCELDPLLELHCDATILLLRIGMTYTIVWQSTKMSCLTTCKQPPHS